MIRRIAPLLILAAVSHAALAESDAGNDTDTEPVCGNGRIEGDEECDDGNTRDHDHCDASCQIEPLWGCGDTVLAAPVECDDDGALCMPTCQVESF